MTPSSGTIGYTIGVTLSDDVRLHYTRSELHVDPDDFTAADIVRCKSMVEAKRRAAGCASDWPFTHTELGVIIRTVGGDLDLAAEACAMDPLPDWIVNVMKGTAA